VRHRFFLIVALSLLTMLVVPGSTSALPPAPQPSCSPGPADCGAWHTGNVTVSWSAPSCPAVTISDDTAGTGVSCTVSDGSGSVTSTVIVRRDATPPGVRASAEREPDNNGWYNRPVSVSFSGDDGTSGIAGCSSATYGGPDTGGASVSGSCTDNAGNTGRASIDIKYDATAPAVEARPDRQPDANGWYNHALTVAFVGTDPMSGVDFCATPVVYKGPDAPRTSIAGTCRDKAANTSPPVGFELRYDTRPPVLGRLKAVLGRAGVVLRWTASKDTHAFAVARQPGLKGPKPSTVYTGKARAFTDRRMREGVKYRYTIAAYDEAGNAAVKALVVRPDGKTNRARAAAEPAARPARPATPALSRPAQGARVTAPPVLDWTPVPKAKYYNVQLYRDGKKILTVWPSSTSYRLRLSWTFDGRRQRLSPGRYTWYVWPGFGPRSANRYGKLVGSRTFVVTRS
jgi:hypothetical protein